MSMSCCSIRPARSRSAVAGPRPSCRLAVSMCGICMSRPRSPPWPTAPRRVRASSPLCWRPACRKPRSLPRAASEFVEFTAQTRMSGVDLADGRQIRKGAPDAVVAHLRRRGTAPPARLDIHDCGSSGGGRDAARGRRRATAHVGVVVLQDTLKPNIDVRVALLRQMGLHTIMVTGDNRLTAATIAKRAGVDDFSAGSDPGSKARFSAQGAGRGQAGRNDGRRHERRAGLGAGRCRTGDELRHPGRQGSRQHGRSRQRPDQADRGRWQSASNC